MSEHINEFENLMKNSFGEIRKHDERLIEENVKLLNENYSLRKNLKDLEKKHRTLKNQLVKLMKPINTIYDFTDAPNFLKVLNTLDSIEDMERYMLQLGCFITNTRLENQLVITGPCTFHQSFLARIGRIVNSDAVNTNLSKLCSVLFGINCHTMPNFCSHVSRKVTKQNPFIHEAICSSHNFDICIELTKRKWMSSGSFMSYLPKEGYFKNYECDGITSPVILACKIPNLEREDCDIIHTEVEHDTIDMDLFFELKTEAEAIKKICMQVYEKNKDKIIDR